MKTLTRSLTLAAMLGAVLAVQPVLARERPNSATGPKGNSVQRDVTRANGDVSSTTTGPKGETRSRDVTRTDGDTQASVTGRNGRVWNRSVDRSKTPNGASATSTVTGPEGKTVTSTRAVIKPAPAPTPAPPTPQ